MQCNWKYILALFIFQGFVGFVNSSELIDVNLEIQKREAESKEVEIHQKGSKCTVLDRNATLCDEDIQEDNTVTEGTICIVGDELIGTPTYLSCIDGKWIVDPIDQATIAIRNKRSHAVLCTTVISRRRCWWSRRQRVVTTCVRPNHPPSISCTPTITFTTPARATYMYVSWRAPIAYDFEDGPLSVRQTYGPKPGTYLSGSSTGTRYTVYYYVRDSSGATASCTTTLIVKVVYCPSPSLTTYGTFYCPNGYMHGQTCTLKCYYGYSTSISTITCQQNGQWTSPGPCLGIPCRGIFPWVRYGSYSCVNFRYGSRCYPTCNPGCIALPYPIWCGIDGILINPPAIVCSDTEPPTLTGCPPNIVKAADVGLTSAIVTWQLPTATDRQDPSPVVKQTSGSISPNTRIAGGFVHVVKYVAYDKTGNPSKECSFTVQVIVTCCSALTSPTQGQYSCDKGVIYGSQCTFTCNKGYTIQGSNKTSCTEYGTWTTPAPTCNVVSCLHPANYGLTISNGYYECPSVITYQIVCIPKCNSGYKLEQNTTAVCTVDGNNTPRYNVSTAPTCKDYEPPVFTNCSETRTIILNAIKGTTSATVIYTMPRATDNVDSKPTVKKISGPDPGDTVDVKNIAYVEFRATDSSGNPSTRCIYALQVKVFECKVYEPPVDGKLSCTVDNIYGSACTLACNEGHESTGSSSTECLQSGNWSATDLGCRKKQCPSAPEFPSNGLYICPSQSYPYNTLCYASCNQGFKILKPSFARCSAQQTWEFSTNTSCTDSEPPVLTNCETELTIPAESRSTSAVVNWTVPTASDNVDESLTVVQLTGPKPGTRIQGETTVKYQTTDQAGNPSEICSMQIKVEVIQCPSPQWPKYGEVRCDMGNIYGSNCSYTCDKGYTVSQPSYAQCQKNKTWTYGNQPPSCKEISCGQPANPANGTFVCFDSSFSYESVCVLECIKGFSTSRTVYASCQASGEWFTGSSETCTDSTPPVLTNCKSYQTFYAERGMNTANASWTIPSAIDNVDNTTDIIMEQISGPSRGSPLPIGTTLVEYRAKDTAGNPSVTTCSITIHVEAIFCNHPKYSFDDSNLEYTCPNLRWGDACKLSCPVSKSLKYKGPTEIKCEATFSGSNPSTSWTYDGRVKPHCEAEVCPKNLTTPKYGSLSYSNDAQPVAFVFCDEAHDTPIDFNGQILCLDTGKWNQPTVPDCTDKFIPSLNVLPVEYHYSGLCGTEATLAEIKTKVLKFLEAFRGSQYAPDCFSDSSCGFDDVIVSCGSSIKRRSLTDEDSHNRERRQTSTIRVQFSLTLIGEVSSRTEFFEYQSQLFNISDSLKTAMVAGSFDIDGLQTLPDSYTRAINSEIKCNGTGFVRYGYSCKSCARGSYLGEVNGKKTCVTCPVGTYMNHDAATSCYPCPSGTSTNTTGCKSIDMCTDYCSAGYESPTRVEPCSPCIRGQYQDNAGQSSCKTCDFGQTTFQQGATNCSYYDIILRGNNSFVSYVMDTDWNEMFLSFWIRIEEGSQVSVVFGSVLEITFRKSLDSCDISGRDILAGNINQTVAWSNKWVHIVVKTTSNSLSIYKDGNIIIQDTDMLSSGRVFGASTSVAVSYDTDTDIRVSSLILTNDASYADVASLSSSCLTDTTNAKISSDKLLSIPNIIVDPSTCIATDACADDPCGSNICTPTIAGFICTCLGGYSGSRCEVPPDYCYENQCQNRASCISTNKNYTCVCRPGYNGQLCQNPPVNGGWGAWTSWSICSASCDGGVWNRSRVCDNPEPEEYGQDCIGVSREEGDCNEEDCKTLDPCLSSPCGNHECKLTANGFVCQCNKGYTGSSCETLVDYCNPNPCKNGGTCVSIVGNFTCDCKEGFLGEICEQEDLSICYWTTWSPCSASCGGGTSSRKWICKFGNGTSSELTYTRPCNSDLCKADLCLSSPCGENNTCTSTDDSFTCLCGIGKTGASCDADVNFCANNQCEHGVCSNTGAGYTCTCDKGYSGDICNIPAVNGIWGEWGEWSNCSSLCNGGKRSRIRLCDNPPPSLGGKECSGINVDNDTCSAECKDACASKPCGSVHDCINEGDSYKCSCKNGFSGLNCTTPPNYCDPNPCQNGGQCTSNSSGFVCNCVGGYRGEACDIEEDKSVWEAWSGWTDCSVTCGGGSQTRTRDCQFGSKGEACPGNKEEANKCGQESCPECPELRNYYGMMKSCIYKENVTCTVQCAPGFSPSNVTYDKSAWSIVYHCGPYSGYKWNLTEETPSCTENEKPSLFVAEAIIPFSPPVPCGLSRDLENSMLDKVAAVACKAGTDCQIGASVSTCNNRKRRQTDSGQGQITFTFTFNLTNVPDNVSDYWDVANDSLSPIITNGGEWLAVELDGVKFVADTSNITDDAKVECSEGYFLQEGFAACVGCTPGTMYNPVDGYCYSCPIGTYQELAAQNCCTACPDGYTTGLTGSYDRNDCQYTTAETESETSTGIIIGTCVGGVVLTITIITIVVYRIKRANRLSKVRASRENLRQMNDLPDYKFSDSRNHSTLSMPSRTVFHHPRHMHDLISPADDLPETVLHDTPLPKFPFDRSATSGSIVSASAIPMKFE